MSSVCVDGLWRLAEMGFKGRWKWQLESGCCERMDVAVRTPGPQANRVNHLPQHGVSSLAQVVSKLAVP